MDIILSFISEVGRELEPYEILISLITMIFAGYASLRLWKRNTQLRKDAKNAPKIFEDFKKNIIQFEGVNTEKPVALAMSLVPQTPSIKNDVQKYLDIMNWKMDIEELNMNGINNSEDLEKFFNQLREKRHLFDLDGRTEVHLFLQGPVFAGILIGAMFDNWKPVKLYHKPNNPPVPSIYQYLCPLVK